MPCGIKRCPPTPFDFNRLHTRCLSRQRSRVRVSSSPPFLIKHLRLWKSFRAGTEKGTNSARGVKFRAQLPYNNVYVQPRPWWLIALLRALAQLLFAISNNQRDYRGVGCTLGGCHRLGVSIQGHTDRGVSQQFLHSFRSAPTARSNVQYV